MFAAGAPHSQGDLRISCITGVGMLPAGDSSLSGMIHIYLVLQ